MARQRPGFVDHTEVQAAGVVFRIHGDGGQTHVGRGAALRMAISPRLAISSFVTLMVILPVVPEGRSPRRWAPDHALVRRGHGSDR
jgi:hypothetical protein